MTKDLKASCTAYKDGERVECSDEYSDDYENVENESLDTSSNEGETIIVPDRLPRKSSKKDIPVDQRQQYKKTNSKTPISIDMNPHQLF